MRNASNVDFDTFFNSIPDPTCPQWQKEQIMNRVNNWIFLAIFFGIISFSLMTFWDKPVIALCVGIPCLLSMAMALIRLEDYNKAADVGHGA